MSLNKKENIKQIENIINNNETIKEEEYAYIIDSKNILKKENLKNMNENLFKFFGLQLDTSDEDIVNQSTKSSINNSVGNASLDNNAQKLMHIFTERLFPKCNLDGFLISRKLSANYFKKIMVDKNKIEECINYIYSHKQKFAYSGLINFDLKTIENLGYILMMSYYKFNDFKVTDRKALKACIKKTNKDSTDVIQDFFNYCNKKKSIPDHHKKTSYWERNSTNYYLPAIFIFLMNSLEKIETINIDFNIYDETISNEDVDFFAIVIYNVQFIFNNVSQIKLNLIHTKLQCGIFSKYFEEYKKALNDINGEIKKRYINLDYIYDKKWDFTTEFLLDEYRQINKKIFLENKNDYNLNIMNKSKTNDLKSDLTEIRNETKNIIKSSGRSKLSEFFHDIKSNLHQRFSVQVGHLSPKITKCNIYSGIEEEIIEENEHYSNNNPDIIYNRIDIYNDYYLNILKCFLLAINSINRFNNICKLDLVFNDSYSSNFCNFFENEIFDQENKSANIALLKDFHLLDIISNKFIKLNTLNLEINSLDSITFIKLLEAININPNSLVSLNFSFFTSDITYFPQSLYKLYNPQYSLKSINSRDNIELKILDYLLVNFTTNLKILFNLIRHKRIQILGFNFDLPGIIENNQKYNIVLIKFILNILLYILKKDTVIQKVIILAPKVKISDDFYPFVNKVLGNININDSNKTIKELSFQIQLYKIINVKKIIGESLIILNIGNCDIYTFKELVQYLASYKFSIRSSLSQLTISLVKSLRILSKELYKLLFLLFNIKIKQLKELNLITNIIINHIKEYLYLLNIFNNNWISSCTLTLNPKSEKIYKLEQCKEERNKIKYLVPGCLENDLFSPEDMVLKKKINNDKITKNNDDAFWYLKYMFQKNFLCIDNHKKKRNERLSKFLTNNVLSYIHFQKKIKLYHTLEEKDKNEL